MDWISFKKEIEEELTGNILPFWRTSLLTPDDGFIGEIDNDNCADYKAPLGLVMLARLLWTYSDAYLFTSNEADKEMAFKARTSLFKHLEDKEWGGFYWLADSRNGPVQKRKILYGQGFALYALSAWQQVSPSEENADFCHNLFRLIEEKGRDKEYGGYFEGRETDWSGDGTNSLGNEDMLCFKSMNTNLHILEAYSRYYEVFRTDEGAEALESLINIIISRIYNPERKHQELYFNKDWTPESRGISSFGHDVETSWLLLEALEILGDKDKLADSRSVILDLINKSIAEAAAPDGSLYNEEKEGELDQTRVWWVQAEYLVSLMNAYQMTGMDEYHQRLEAVWKFIKEYLICPNGEWYAELDADCKPKNQPKGGMWKTPYHNGRACMELMKRIDLLFKEPE